MSGIALSGNYPSTFPAGIAGTPVPAGTYYVPTATKPNAAIANTWTYFSEATAIQRTAGRFQSSFRSGFALRGVYTWSKTIDDGDSLNATTSGGEPALASNPFNLRADRGWRTSMSATWQRSTPSRLPCTRCRSAQRSGTRLLGGWKPNIDRHLQGGFPFTPQLSYNPSNNGDTRNPVRPFVNPAFTGPVILGNPNQWFNPAAFLAPPTPADFTEISGVTRWPAPDSLPGIFRPSRIQIARS